MKTIVNTKNGNFAISGADTRIIPISEDLTINRWFDIWFDHYKSPHLKPTTLDTYRSLYDRHVRFSFGEAELAYIKPIDIQRLYDGFIASGYSPRYLNTLHTMLNSMFKKALANDLIIKNPCTDIERPATPQSERRVLTRDEQMRMMKYIHNTRFSYIEPLITTLLGTGLRIGEALGLRWSDINLNSAEPTIHVNRTLVRVSDNEPTVSIISGSRYLLQAPKTKTSIRTIPLQKSVIEALERQRAIQNRYRARPEWSPIKGFEDLVFSGKKGQPQWRSTISSSIDTIVRTMNDEEFELAATECRPPKIMDKILPHSFRHTFATRCLEAGIPPKVVQTWLGHSSIKITMDLYTHVNQDVSFKNMKLLEKSMEI